jgi:hypothetical protein
VPGMPAGQPYRSAGTLLTFYLNQFGAVATAMFQFLVLLMVIAYQRWYLSEESE